MLTNPNWKLIHHKSRFKVALVNDKQPLPDESQPTIQTRSAKRAKIDNEQSERKSDDAVEDYSIDDDHTGDYNFWPQ